MKAFMILVENACLNCLKHNIKFKIKGFKFRPGIKQLFKGTPLLHFEDASITTQTLDLETYFLTTGECSI